MASISRESSRDGFRLQFYVNNRKKSVWLGGVTKKQAETIKTHVEYLITAKKTKLPPPAITANWLGELSSTDEDLFDRLAVAGLVAERPRKNQTTLLAYIDDYIASAVSKKPRTIEKYKQARDSLVALFTADRMIDTINTADAERWREWMLAKGNRRDQHSEMAQNTVRRRTGIAKQFFDRAVKDGLIASNPFAGLPCAVGANADRQYFVEQSVIDRVITKAPDAEWRAFLALARYGGLRCPSEPLSLRWEDVNLPDRVLSIDSPKTGLRVCPIFPELYPYLEELAMDARSQKLQPSDYVFRARRGSETVWRAGLLRMLKRCGIVPWPRLFQNLRASRETELLGVHPVRDVCSWIGNSQAVAMKHYAMARSTVFAAATGLGTDQPPIQPAHQRQCSTGGSIIDWLRSICGSTTDSNALQKPLTLTLTPKYLLYKNEESQAITSIAWDSVVGEAGLELPCGIIGISESGVPTVLQVVLSRDVRCSLDLPTQLRRLALEAAQ